MASPHESFALATAIPMATYKHTALARPGSQIRLLTLTPAARTEPLSGTLRTVDLEYSYYEYRTISYTWGSTAKPCSLCIEGRTLPIGRNLHDALLEIRHRWYDMQTIWIDSVCIDQENAEELTEQVAIMRHIYSRSLRTVAWLGTGYGRKTNKALFSFLEYVAFYESSMELKGNYSDRELLGGGANALETLFRAFDTGEHYAASTEVSLITTLLDFCNNPYFLRRWVVQEIGVASNIVVLLGDQDINGSTVAIASRLLNVEGSPIREIEGYNGIMLLLQKRIVCVLERMERFRHFDCRDDRDRVAALLWPYQGFPEQHFQGYRVVYSRSTNDNYQRFALMMYQSTEGGTSLPSWNGQQVFCTAMSLHRQTQIFPHGYPIGELSPPAVQSISGYFIIIWE